MVTGKKQREHVCVLSRVCAHMCVLTRVCTHVPTYFYRHTCILVAWMAQLHLKGEGPVDNCSQTEVKPIGKAEAGTDQALVAGHYKAQSMLNPRSTPKSTPGSCLPDSLRGFLQGDISNLTCSKESSIHCPPTLTTKV